MTYGLLRYLNPDIDLTESDPPIGFNYLGRLCMATGQVSDAMWQVSQDALAATGAATAVPMPLAHTLELNVVTVDTDTGHNCRPTGCGHLRGWITRRSVT
ncbi:linear gramicidin synthetase subunit D domain protein [Mycobacterium xenopi 4042]|uniref:Linear gramicidin synthetase subunit D domain protein n=1 Tax=Mycobacterium xenopi 4042 TaxID=1299334 RepID=X7YL24_MYCXE|nr:linear gramicidin synthetase subunit D domain protein [Mycobacterium xenopi 4042]